MSKNEISYLENLPEEAQKIESITGDVSIRILILGQNPIARRQTQETLMSILTHRKVDSKSDFGYILQIINDENAPLKKNSADMMIGAENFNMVAFFDALDKTEAKKLKEQKEEPENTPEKSQRWINKQVLATIAHQKQKNEQFESKADKILTHKSWIKKMRAKVLAKSLQSPTQERQKETDRLVLGLELKKQHAAKKEAVEALWARVKLLNRVGQSEAAEKITKNETKAIHKRIDSALQILTNTMLDHLENDDVYNPDWEVIEDDDALRETMNDIPEMEGIDLTAGEFVANPMVDYATLMKFYSESEVFRNEEPKQKDALQEQIYQALDKKDDKEESNYETPKYGTSFRQILDALFVDRPLLSQGISRLQNFQSLLGNLTFLDKNEIKELQDFAKKFPNHAQFALQLHLGNNPYANWQNPHEQYLNEDEVIAVKAKDFPFGPSEN